ncbi:SMAD/FHA domain-containing protein [Zychaea mexicana]|uniref:SMAD/FHA domain-containing protein n=1 Tax=Zychaea mexicana TaxID=64656 RepID=UPI0022FEABBE|nr:SMAD/FHA domain-containing protein [Zychaea mexicana]KAI9492601.1 SMAD/FHA domain-containing protein [Zychaea mexicana]
MTNATCTIKTLISATNNEQRQYQEKQEEEKEEDRQQDQQTTTLLIDTVYLVVLESNRLSTGQVVIVDTQGLTVGRDRSWEERHLRLAELPVSKYHCQIYYNEDTKQFQVIDFGSRNGTFLNQQRLSGTKSSSVPASLSDLDHLQIGSTLFQVHKHKQPCHQCVSRDQNTVDLSDGTRKDGIANNKEQQPVMFSTHSDLGSTDMKEREWMQELRRLKRSYAPVAKEKNTKSDYVDAAERRRQLYASTTISSHLKRPHADGDVDEGKQERVEKTERATMQTQVQGIGNTMLRKMGWQEGQSLGRTGADGIVAPISPSTQTHRRGLGSSSSVVSTQDTTATASKQLKYSKLPSNGITRQDKQHQQQH